MIDIPIKWSSGVKTAETKAAEQAAKDRAARKLECRDRIFAVVSQTAQMNLFAASMAGELSDSQMAAWHTGWEWIKAMRAAVEGDTWPEVPEGVAELAAAF